MKNKILIAVIGASLLLGLEGCKTSPQVVAIKTEGVIVVTVDTGMKAWASYVNAGKASMVQVNAVQDAYNKYYSAQIAAESILLAVVSNTTTNTVDLANANTSVVNAENQLLVLLNTYIK